MLANDFSFPHKHSLPSSHLFKLVLNPIAWFELEMFGCLLHYVSLCHTASPNISNFPRTVWMKTQDSLPVSIWNSNTLSIQDLLDLTRVEVGQGLHLTFASSLMYPYFSEATIRNSLFHSSLAPPWLRPLSSQVSASILSNNQIMLPKTLTFSPLKRNPDETHYLSTTYNSTHTNDFS